jgi:hypothetical protein
MATYLPPQPAVISKMRYYLMKKLSPELFSVVEKELSPFPKFRLYAKFRETFTNDENEFIDEDLSHLIDRESNHFEDIDDCLNMLTRLENALKLHIKKTGIITTGIQYRYNDEDVYCLSFQRDCLLS